MRSTKISYWKGLVSALILIISFACSDEREMSTNPSKQARGSFELTENDENAISVIDILAFRVDENDNTKEYFVYKTRSKDISSNEVSGKKTFTATLLKGGTTKYRFVLLANAEAEVESLGNISTSTLKEDVLKRVTSFNSGKWITDTANSSYKDIPMWAETPQMVINDNTNSITGIHLIRMLSRIDVTVDAATQSTFKMNSIRVYNYNTYGQVASSTNASYWDGTKALKPTLPDTPGKEKGPLVYDQISTPGIASNKGIYVYESAGLPDAESANAICLVVGGEYNNEGKETFYKINFRNTTANIDLLRNYLYNVKIKNVQSSGYDTPDAAFNAKAVNITSEIAVWDQGELTDIVSDNQYFLGVSKKQFSFPMNEIASEDPDFQLVVATDDPNGWNIEKTIDPENNAINWLTASPNNGSVNNKTTLSLFVQENITGLDRTAYLYIKAGRLRQIIEVVQTAVPEINLLIENNNGEEVTELIFGSQVGGTVPPQTFTVKWLPKSANNNITVSTVSGSEIFNFGSGDVITTGSISDGNGIKTYNIQPPPMTPAEVNADPFLEKASRIDFSITNGFTYESKTLFLVQKNFDAVPTVDANFAMDGSEQYFTINANAPWEIEVNSDPLNIIQELITTIGGTFEDKRTERVYFRTNDYNPNPDITEGDVSFTIKSTNPQRPFPSRTVTIKCYSGEVLPTSNTYLIPSSNTLGKVYLIPVSRANEGLQGSIGVDDKLEAYLVWADDQNHVTTTIIRPVGRGNTGYIYIYPGSPQGNDVVAVRVNGIIKWSWHLWIANYDPLVSPKTLNGFTLMSRNLGALSDAQGNVYSLGNFYQWGRKDPYPQANGISSNIGFAIYNAGGTVVTTPSTATASLESSIQNPLLFFISAAGWTGSADANSWNNGGAKTVYDPCPPGWKVPPTNVWNGLNTTNFAWNATNRGRNHSTAGWFPASGIRESNTANIGQVGATGSYWTSTSSIHLAFYSNTVTPNQSFSVQNGFLVRCIRE